MATLVALYQKPTDPQAFDKYYLAHHIPLAKTIPGLRRFEISNGAVSTPLGESAYHLVAMLGFDSLEALKHGLDSPQGRATAGDLGNFAQAGAELLIFDSKVV